MVDGFVLTPELVGRMMCPSCGATDLRLEPEAIACEGCVTKFEMHSRLFDLDVQVTNHAPEVRIAEARLVLPEGWSADPETVAASIEPSQMRPLAFRVQTAAGDQGIRCIVIADLTFGDRHYGQRAEAIVDIKDPTEGRMDT